MAAKGIGKTNRACRRLARRVRHRGPKGENPLHVKWGPGTGKHCACIATGAQDDLADGDTIA